MPKASPGYTSFNAGEWSPLMAGRFDLQKYTSACETMLNFMPKIQGPAQRRPGTRFIIELKDSTALARILPFEFNVTQAYVIEAGEQYFRFVREHGQIVDDIGGAVTVDAVDQGTDTFTIAGDRTGVLTEGDKVTVTGSTGNDGTYTVVSATLNGGDTDVVVTTDIPDATADGTMLIPVEVATPYQASDLAQLKFIQSADVLYLFHPDYMPRKLSRTSHVSWSVDAIVPQDGPYLATNATSTTLGLSGTSGSVTVTASGTTGINGGSGFLTTDVGRLIRWRDTNADWTWLEITAHTNTTTVTATIRGPNASAGTATVNWRLGVWSGTTGFPSCGAFYEDRLVLGGVPEYPQRFDLSRTGDYENFQPTDPDGTVVSDHALAFTINANNVNVIRWILDDEKGLLLGTVGGEWVLRPAAVNEALDAENLPQVRRATTWGSADVQALKAGNAVVFVQRASKKLMETAYFFEDDGFRSGDLTELAEHITGDGISEVVYQREPDSTIWAVRVDGTLLGMTYRREQSVFGWHRHVLGGVSDAIETQAKVDSIAVIPSPTGDRDELYMVAQRYIDGEVRRYIEYMAAPLPQDGDVADALYVDSALTYDGTPTAAIAGLDHLEGETVQILADGASHPDRLVSGGAVTLDREAGKAQIGLGYDGISELRTLSLEAGSADGTAQGKTKRITNCSARFDRSRGARIGPSAATLDPITELMYRNPSTPMGQPDPLFTGVTKPVTWPGKYETEARITLVPDGAFPCTVMGLYPQVVTNDR